SHARPRGLFPPALGLRNSKTATPPCAARPALPRALLRRAVLPPPLHFHPALYALPKRRGAAPAYPDPDRWFLRRADQRARPLARGGAAREHVAWLYAPWHCRWRSAPRPRASSTTAWTN